MQCHNTNECLLLCAVPFDPVAYRCFCELQEEADVGFHSENGNEC